MFGNRYFGARYFGDRYFGQGAVPSAGGGYFSHRYFGARYFAPRYFNPAVETAGSPGAAGGYFGHRFFVAPFFAPRYFAPPYFVILEPPGSPTGSPTDGIGSPTDGLGSPTDPPEVPYELISGGHRVVFDLRAPSIQRLLEDDEEVVTFLVSVLNSRMLN